jgi:phage recombination protein Bet
MGTTMTATEEREIVRQNVAVDCSPVQFEYFLAVARKVGLDPLMKQIYAVVRRGRLTIQTGIDGYRAVAHRSGEYLGLDPPQFGDDELRGPWCLVTVYRRSAGERCAFPAVAFMREYWADAGLWPKMPWRMLEKCAEALALRKAFPEQLSGVYTSDEMAQADDAPLPVALPEAQPAPAPARRAPAPSFLATPGRRKAAPEPEPEPAPEPEPEPQELAADPAPPAPTSAAGIRHAIADAMAMGVPGEFVRRALLDRGAVEFAGQVKASSLPANKRAEFLLWLDAAVEECAGEAAGQEG